MLGIKALKTLLVHQNLFFSLEFFLTQYGCFSSQGPVMKFLTDYSLQGSVFTRNETDQLKLFS